MIERAHWTTTVEGYANFIGGRSQSEEGRDATGRSRLDVGLRVLALHQAPSGLRFGARGEALSSPEDRIESGERSALALGEWGRLELGKRRGLPTTISGYAPNNFTYTGAEFSVPSGRGLDPGDTLATSFLAPGLAAQIDAVSTLGFAPRLFNDQSGKLIYVAPKLRGWQFGASYSPRAEEQDGRFEDLAQLGLTREVYAERNVYRVGGSFVRARGGRDPLTAFPVANLHSLNVGVAVTFVDAWTLGAALTYDGDSGLSRGPLESERDSAYGQTFSVNFNSGPWTVGGYGQYARSAGDPATAGTDLLRLVQIGLSYRTSTRVRLFGATYRYRFADEGGRRGDFDGTVALAGLRVTL